MSTKKLVAAIVILAVALAMACGIIIGMQIQQRNDGKYQKDAQRTEASEVQPEDNTEIQSETLQTEWEQENKEAEHSNRNEQTNQAEPAAEELAQNEQKKKREEGERPMDAYGALRVDGNKLVDKEGNAVQLKGVSTHGIQWYPQYVNETSIRFMRDHWDIDVIRLAMYTAEYNGYCVGDDNNRQTIKNDISEGVNAATNLGMYVIIDWHILSDSNPMEHKGQAISFFEEMASRYQGYDNVIYEICNEPNQGANWSDIKAYANEVIPVIRKYDQDAIILVGTPTWSQDVDQALADPITGYDNVMYVLHFYADTHRDDLRNKLEHAYNGGLPIFVSEFGICDASGNGAINIEEADKWIALLDKYDISYVAWNLSNKDESSAFFKKDCDKTTDFTEDDLTDSARWFLEVLKR